MKVKILNEVQHIRSKCKKGITSQRIYSFINKVSSIYFLASYLGKKKQRTNVNGSYGNFDDIFSGVPQGSLLCPFSFNVYICDLFFGIEDLDIFSYAEDNMS